MAATLRLEQVTSLALKVTLVVITLARHTGTTCNAEQKHRCRQAAEAGQLESLQGGGQCVVNQYAHYTHVCTVSNYVPSVDFCCCSHRASYVMCCRYHQGWNHFRCAESDDTIDTPQSSNDIEHESGTPNAGGVDSFVLDTTPVLNESNNLKSTPLTVSHPERPPQFFECKRTVYGVCAGPLEEEFRGLDLEGIREKIATTPLRDICRIIIPIPPCIRATLDEVCSEEAKEAILEHYGNDLTAHENAINYVCVENVDVFDEHKQCLTRVAVSGNIQQQCRHLGGPCPTIEFVDCGVDVLRNQCGDEIAQHVRTVMANVVRDTGCQAKFKKFKRGGHFFMKKTLGLFY